ncbi:uncharacterized protein LOC111087606 [Limulus polyphemus]|uniref:Uncharacterized protein LOC111087606 n=1 Tax=Limulus polyphemus TaxID=6850 RepID=A0ABM1T3S2_LIMPO|nr:uncharacterized protein LOC111087606 [Limulus polyphemus]
MENNLFIFTVQNKWVSLREKVVLKLGYILRVETIRPELFGVVRLMLLDKGGIFHLLCHLVVSSSSHPQIFFTTPAVTLKEGEPLLVKLSDVVQIPALGTGKFWSYLPTPVEQLYFDTINKTWINYTKAISLIEKKGPFSVNISFQDSSTVQADDLFKMTAKTPNSESWEPVDLISGTILPLTSDIKITSHAGMHGRSDVNVKLFNSKEETLLLLDEKTLSVQVNPKNSAPVPRMNILMENLPHFSYLMSSKTFTVSQFMTPVYKDSDGDELGIAVLIAEESEIGMWQYKTTEQSVWQSLPVASNRSSFSNMSLEFIPYNFGLIHHRSLNQGMTKSVSMKAVFLSPSTELRFVGKYPDVKYSIFEAAEKVMLLGTAWDMTDSRGDGEVVDMNLANCALLCGKEGPLAEDFMVYYLEQRDCLDLRVIDHPLMEDDCGVCGGDGLTCRDCTGIYNGNFSEECGLCTSEKPEDIKKSCANFCEKQEEVIKINDKYLCVQKELPQDQCDEADDKNAYVNVCGYCVEKKTERMPDYGMDKCDVCDGNNLCIGCDGVPHSGKKTDVCGNCLLPTDLHFNSCTAFLLLWPEVIDMTDPNEPVNITIQMTKALAKDNIECKLEPVGNIESSSKESLPEFHAAVQKEIYIVTFWRFFANVPVGAYELGCTFKDAGKVEQRNLRVYHVNSASQKIEKIFPKKLFIMRDTKVTLTLSENVLDTGKLGCIFSIKNIFGLTKDILSKEKVEVQGKNFTCLFPSSVNLVGLASVTLSHFSDEGPFPISGKSPWISVVSKAPTPVRNFISDSLYELIIVFDMNIFMKEPCQQLFNTDTTKNLIFKGCEIENNIIQAQLDFGSKVKTNMSIDLLPGLLHYRTKNVDFTEKMAAQQVAVQWPENPEMPSFSLVGPSVVCNQVVQLSLRNLRGGEVFGFIYSWMVINQSKTNGWHPFSIPLYSYVGSSFWAHTLDIPIIACHVPGAFTLVVDWIPVQTTFIRWSGLLILLFSSGFDFSRYFWSVNSSDFQVPAPWGPVLSLSPGEMKGGKTYLLTLTVYVDRGTVLFNSSIKIQTSLPPLIAITHTSKLVIGYNQTFCVDGSMSYDPGDKEAKLEYVWTCRKKKAIGYTGCHTLTSKSKRIRLEMHLRDAIFLPHFCVPGGLLHVGEYSFTLSVLKKKRIARSTTAVIISSWPDIPIVTIPRTVNQLNVTPDTGKYLEIPAYLDSKQNALVRWTFHNDAKYQITEDSETSETFMFKGLSRAKPISLTSEYIGNIYLNVSIELLVEYPSTNVSLSSHSIHFKGSVNKPRIVSFEVTPSEGNCLLTPFNIKGKVIWNQKYYTSDSYFIVFHFSSGATTIYLTPGVQLDLKNLHLPCGSGEKSDRLLISLAACSGGALCARESTEVVLNQAASTSSHQDLDHIVQTIQESINKGDIRRTFLNSWAVLLSSNENSEVYQKAKSAIEIIVWRGVLLFSQGLINATNQTPEAVRLLHVMMSDNHWNILSIEGKLAITLLKDEIFRAISSTKIQRNPKQRVGNNKKSSTYDQSKVQVANSALLSTSVSHRNLGTSFSKYFSPWMAETLLQAIDKEIDLQLMFYMQLTETKKIFDNVNFLTRSLCYHLKEGLYLDTKALSSKISLLVYKPVSLIKEDFYSAVFTHFISSDAKVGVLFSSTLLNRLAIKTCADGLPCHTACIGISLYTTDFWSPQTGLLNNPEKVYDIVEIHLFSSDSVTPIRPEKQKDAVTIIFGGHPLLPTVIQLSLGVSPILNESYSSTVLETDEFHGTTWRKECFMWEVDHWDSQNCMTNTTIPGITICSCKSFGVVGVFKVNGSNYKSTVTPETESPNTFPPVSKAQRVSFKINGDYKLLVGDRKSEFLENMKKQIAKLLNIPPSAIRNLDAQPGSVDVFFELDPNQVNVTLIMETIATMISNGEFPLKDLNNQVIEIEIDSLSFATPPPATLSPAVVVNSKGFKVFELNLYC